MPIEVLLENLILSTQKLTILSRALTQLEQLIFNEAGWGS